MPILPVVAVAACYAPESVRPLVARRPIRSRVRRVWSLNAVHLGVARHRGRVALDGGR